DAGTPAADVMGRGKKVPVVTRTMPMNRVDSTIKTLPGDGSAVGWRGEHHSIVPGRRGSRQMGFWNDRWILPSPLTKTTIQRAVPIEKRSVILTTSAFSAETRPE